MKKTLAFILFLAIFSCKTRQGKNLFAETMPDGHQFTVLEVQHTTNYTYLRGSEKNEEKWFALPLFDAKTGTVYYYKESMEMVNFQSRELNRNFDKIYFLEGISATPLTQNQTLNPAMNEKIPSQGGAMGTGAGAITEKKEIHLKSAKDGLTISEVFQKGKELEGRVVIARGIVVKFSSGILNKNWIHLQDGTDHNGKYDLVVTTDEQAMVGDTLTVEGKITIGKDLGHGYFFEVLLEDAQLMPTR